MKIEIIPPKTTPPCERCCTVSMTIKSFKGRRNVEVHLFRPDWPEQEEKQYQWESLIGPCLPEAPCPEGSSRRVIMESFTLQERDRIINYLKEQYATRLTGLRSLPLEFPVPDGLPALCDAEAGKNIGLIRFERIPSYALNLPMRGLFDLSQHPPIVEEVSS